MGIIALTSWISTCTKPWRAFATALLVILIYCYGAICTHNIVDPRFRADHPHLPPYLTIDHEMAVICSMGWPVYWVGRFLFWAASWSEPIAEST